LAAEGFKVRGFRKPRSGFLWKKNMVFQRVGGQRSTPQCGAPKMAKLVNIATITTGFGGIDL